MVHLLGVGLPNVVQGVAIAQLDDVAKPEKYPEKHVRAHVCARAQGGGGEDALWFCCAPACAAGVIWSGLVHDAVVDAAGAVVAVVLVVGDDAGGAGG